MPTPLPQVSMLTLAPGIFEVFLFRRALGNIEVGEGGLEVIGKNLFSLPYDQPRPNLGRF